MKILLRCSWLILFLHYALPSRAQYQMIVDLLNGSSESFQVSDIRSIKFNGTNMLVNQNDGTVNSFAIGQVARYTFLQSSGVTSSNHADKNDLRIYPNPASRFLEIVYVNYAPEQIVVDVTDMLGRPLTQVYSGHHLGSRSYKQSIDLPAGAYLCRISSGVKTYYKPFLVN